uniref:TonB-dependent receptor n=1 Tax=Dialister sp. TaxID=1955814 RepID=UPI004028EAF1
MKDMKKTAALLAAMALLGVGSASAAEAAPMFALQGVTVTANRQAESLKDVPANVQVITEKDIKLRNVQTASDAVAMATGVSASNSVEGTVNLRGYNSKNILVLVDGQQMNTAWNGDVDWNMIPVENIRKIEVVSGGQSALYGGRAVGGVINIITKSEKRDGVHGSAVVSYGSHATVKQAYAVHGKKDKLSWGTFYESKQTNGWKSYDVYLSKKKSTGLTTTTGAKLDSTADGGTIIGNRGNKYALSESYGFNLGYAFNDDQKLTYKYTHSIYDWHYEGVESFTGKWEQSGKYSAKTFLGDKGWRTYNMHSLTYNDQRNKVHAHFGYVDYTKDGSITPGTVDPNNNFDGSGTKKSYPSKSWDFELNKRWTLGTHTILAGTSYGQDQFSQDVYGEVADWKNWNSTVRSNAVEKHSGKDKIWALYLQDKWEFSSKWTAYLGGRYDHYKKYDGFTQTVDTDEDTVTGSTSYGSSSYSKFSPKLSLDYKWDDNTNLYVSYGKSFNPPILYQIYREGTSVLGNTIHSNPDLAPETIDNWEIGMKKKVGNKTDIHADVFYAKTTDAIQSVKSGTEGTDKQYQNVGEAKTHGFEISINQHHSDYWTSYANYTWQVGKIEGKRDWDIPRHLIHVGTTFHKDAWTVNLDGMFISNRYLATSDMNDTKKHYADYYQGGHFKARDAYFLLNLNTNYQFNKNFSMQFAIENVLDREYFDEDISTNHYYIGDGRTFTLSARYAF